MLQLKQHLDLLLVSWIVMETLTKIWALMIISVVISFGEICIAEEEIIVPASNDTEITVVRFPASGNYLMVWLL